jgi:hypothetical protein
MVTSSACTCIVDGDAIIALKMVMHLYVDGDAIIALKMVMHLYGRW